MARPKAAQGKLTREAIVAAALEQIAADGVERLTLAAIARRLDVRTPSIYWYFESKEDLLSALSSGLFDEARAGMPAGLAPRDAMLTIGRNLLATLRARPGAVALVTSARLLPENALPDFIGDLVAGGLDPLEASAKMIAVQALVLGWNGFESNPTVHAAMCSMVDPDAAFEAALKGIIDAPPPDRT